MPARNSIGMADLDLLAAQIENGLFAIRDGCVLEVSTLIWHRNGFDAQQRFEDACNERGIRFRVHEQIGGIEWVCP
jgi:hypothetical protein